MNIISNYFNSDALRSLPAGDYYVQSSTPTIVVGNRILKSDVYSEEGVWFKAFHVHENSLDSKRTFTHVNTDLLDKLKRNDSQGQGLDVKAIATLIAIGVATIAIPIILAVAVNPLFIIGVLSIMFPLVIGLALDDYYKDESIKDKKLDDRLKSARELGL